MIQPTGFFFQANKNRKLGITEAKNFRRVVASVTKDKWHTFEIDLLGDEITATLDGEHSGSYRYDPLTHNIGQFSFAIMGRSARFDNVLMLSRQPSPSDAEQPTSKGKPTSAKQRVVTGPDPTPPLVASQTEHGDAPSEETLEPTRMHARAANDLDADWKRPLQPFFNSYCIDCHGDGADEGGFEFESLGSDLLDAEVRRRWVLAFDRIQKGEMPPPDYDVPEAGDRTEFLTTLSGHLKKAHASEREVVLRRLNRVEYENTINDLFGVDMRLAELLPEESTKHGFDNNGEVLSLSSELIEVYLSTADQILDRVMGPRTPPEYVSIQKSVRDLVHENMYNRWFKLLELDGGTVVYSSEFGAGSQLNLYRTKSEGTYRFRLHAKAWQSTEPVLMQVQSGILTRSGNKRFMGFYSVPPEGRVVEFTDYMFPGESIYPRPFGTIKNISAYLQKGKRKIEEFDGAGLHISSVEIEGPLESWPPESRTRLLGDVSLDGGTADDANRILVRFLPRAFRRNVDSDEVFRYSSKVEEFMNSGRSFEEMKSLKRLLTRLSETSVAGHSLLDESMLMVGSIFGNANKHDTRNMPIVLAGGGFHHGNHLAFDAQNNTPTANLFVSMLRQLGAGNIDSFATSNGSLPGLS
ncbi:MAG: DUF1587 domain-containing protein [Planctomycetota bacterium]